MNTIAVVHPLDPEQRMVINLSDYDPKTMTLWEKRGESEPEKRGPGRPRKG